MYNNKIISILLLFGAFFVFFSKGEYQTVSTQQYRIVGGNVAHLGQFPYQVSIRSNDAVQVHFCGGFIINTRWIGTAAHCTFSLENTDIFVVVGSNSLSVGGDFYNISNIVNHPEWNPKTIENDIALLETSEDIKFSKLVQPIKLSTEYVSSGVEATASGWGKLFEDGPLSEKLLYVSQVTLKNSDCEVHQPDKYKKSVHNSTICAYQDTGSGVCSSDSGGPLVSNGTVIGVVSWSAGCGIGTPDVYSRISSHLPWIMEHIDSI